jgi:Arc/MetJ-type ribon-helix-helix transcriptional regulator
MQEHLPPELRDMVKELIDCGAYPNFEREELRALLDVAIQQSGRGEVAPLDMGAIKAKAALRLQQIP